MSERWLVGTDYHLGVRGGRGVRGKGRSDDRDAVPPIRFLAHSKPAKNSSTAERTESRLRFGYLA